MAFFRRQTEHEIPVSSNGQGPRIVDGIEVPVACNTPGLVNAWVESQKRIQRDPEKYRRLTEAAHKICEGETVEELCASAPNWRKL